MTRNEIGVGVIGLGYMGRTHLSAYRAADAAGFPNRLVAVCDSDGSRLSGGHGPRGSLEDESRSGPLFDVKATAPCAEPGELLANDEVDLVSICTPTDTHVPLAVAALEAGKHVLIEKPVALSSADVRRLAEAARRSDRLCMPAMCMRFWPGWSWLHDRVERGTFGAVRSASFQRLASRPDWSSFYADHARSGGALFDLHVHDADFVRWCFGAPAGVGATGTVDHLTAGYRFEGGPPHVSAEGGWDLSGGFRFRMSYTVAFEEATADYEHGRERALLVHRGGEVQSVPLDPGTGYDGEVRHLLAACASGDGELRATIEDAVGLTALLEAEHESLRVGGVVAPDG